MAFSDEHCEEHLSENVDAAVVLCERSQENLELMEDDSGIVNDFDEHKEDSILTDSTSDIALEHSLEQNAMQRRFLNRSHSLGDAISAVFPVKSNSVLHRRCSLQIPNRLSESLSSEYNHSNAEVLSRSPHIPMVGMGSELFIEFLREEITRSHLQVPESLQRSCGLSSSERDSAVVHEFLSLGAHLRLMADEFASSDQRRRVRERAESVPLHSLDAESFTDLLFGMFQQGGVTCERVLVLFIFCADLAMHALHEHLLARFNDVMNWSQIYIESWLTPWVQRHGGWGMVLERSVHEAYKAAVICVCMVGMLALWTYIRSASH